MCVNLCTVCIPLQANAKLAQIAWERDKLRALVAVDHTSRPLLRFVCSKVLAPLRGDKLFLGRGRGRDASAQETVTTRRLLENFADIAAQAHFVAVRRPLDDGFEVSAVRAAELEKIHITAVQVSVVCSTRLGRQLARLDRGVVLAHSRENE